MIAVATARYLARVNVETASRLIRQYVDGSREGVAAKILDAMCGLPSTVRWLDRFQKAEFGDK